MQSTFWQHIITDLKEKYPNEDPQKWKGKRIKKLLSEIEDQLLKISETDRKWAEDCGVEFTQKTGKVYGFDTPHPTTIQRIFRGASPGSPRLENQFAAFFGYRTPYKYLKNKKANAPTPLPLIDQIANIFRTTYRTKTEFTQIPLLGTEFVEIVQQLPMEDYFVEVSYLPLRQLQRKENLLLREKQQQSLHEKIRAMQLDEAYLEHGNWADARRVLILGNPGVGKSTYARWWCHHWTRQTTGQRIPVYLPLRQLVFTDATDPIAEFIRQYYNDSDWEDRSLGEIIRRDHTHFLLLLDGFDELNPTTQRQLLVLLTDKYTANHYLLLSRPYALTQHRPAVEKAIEILGFGTVNKQRYLVKVLDEQRTKTTDKTAAELWDIIEQRPLLVNLSDNPLLLSYMAVIYLLGDGLTNDLTSVESVYQLQQLVMQCIAHYHSTKTDRYRHNEVDFYQAAANAEALAYTMERQQRFVIHRSEGWATVNANPDLLNQLNSVGLGRYHRLSNADLQFCFTTVSIQEFLAARYLGPTLLPPQFWDFLRDKLHWNFCRMLIGWSVEQKSLQFIQEIWELVAKKWQSSTPNIYALYYQLLFLGELPAKLLRRYVTLEHLKTYHTHYQIAGTQLPQWRGLLIDPLAKIYSKLSYRLQTEFGTYFLQELQRLVSESLQSDYNYETELVIEDLAVLGNQLRLAALPNFLDQILTEVVRIDDYKRETFSDYETDNKIVEHHSFLDNISTQLFRFFTAAPLPLLQQLQPRLQQLMGDQDDDDAISYELQEPIKDILAQTESVTLLIQQLQTAIAELRATEEVENLEDLPNLVERIGNRLAVVTDILTCEQVVADLQELHNLLSKVEEYAGLTGEEWIDFSLVDPLLKTLFQLRIRSAVEWSYELSIDYDIELSLNLIAHPALNSFLEDHFQQLPLDDQSNFEEEAVVNISLFLNFLHCTNRGVYFFSQQRTLFTNYFIAFVKHYNRAVNKFMLEYLEVSQTKEEIWLNEAEEAMLPNIELFLVCFERVVINEHNVDRKYLLRTLLTSEVRDNNFVKYRLLTELLTFEVAIYEPLYWQYIQELTTLNYIPFQLTRLISNSDLYLFADNLNHLLPMWEYLSSYYQQVKVEDIAPNEFGIFSPIANTLKLLIEQPQQNTVQTTLLLEQIKPILQRPVFQDFLFSHEVGRQDLASVTLMSYLLVLYFPQPVVHPRLAEYYESHRADFITVYALLYSVFSKSDISYLQAYLPTAMYEDIGQFYQYYAEN